MLAGYTVIAVEDGVGALRRIESARHIPILVITASDTRRLKDEVDCVLRKPITFERLIAAVESCLRSVRGA